MFKKNEESEWTRFSRALGGAQPAAPTDEDSSPAETQTLPAVDDDYDASDGSRDAVTLAQMPPPAVEPQTYTAPPAAPAYEPDEPLETPSFISAAPPTVATPAFVSTPAPAPRAPAASADETVIGDGASIEGNVRSDKSIRVRGAVQGEIESKQQVIIEESAKVSARIIAEHVTVLGEVDGSIECSGRLEIASSARVTGEVTSTTLVIQEGAFFEGNLKMSASRENV